MPLTSHVLPSHIVSQFRAPNELFGTEIAVIPQLYEWHAKENPNYPLFLYHDGEKIKYITYAMANIAIDRAARYIASSVGSSDKKSLPTVALYANTDTITYFCTAVGIMRAGCPLFLVSSRNASAALVDMFQKTDTTHIIVSPDSTVQENARHALDNLESAGVHVAKHATPTFKDLFSEQLDASSPFSSDVELPQKLNPLDIAIIIHSSGSTGHPKPLGWTYKGIMRWVDASKRVDACGTIMGCHGLPLFHAMGAFMFSAAAAKGFVIATFKPASPPAVPTPDSFWTGLINTGSDYSWSVPSFIEEWARDPQKIAYMKQMRGLVFGGAALTDEVGDAIAAQGITICPIYGSSEVGAVNDIIIGYPGKDWSYWNVTGGLECVFQPAEDGLHELIVISPTDVPFPKTNTKVGDRDAYATGDLVLRHLTNSSLWKIVGRSDDQIILVNGEKTNPIPLEKIIGEDPHVKSSVMFGRGKFNNGILIDPKEEFRFPPNDVKRLEEYRNLIWPTIERANEFAPQHSRIFKEMIIVTSPNKPFQYTIKNAPRRNIIVKEYHDEIEALYKEVEESSQSNIPPPASWDAESTQAFVRAVVESTLQRSIPDDADIFRNGGDSLQATWIRNTIMRAIRETDKAAAKKVPANLVFSAPTISLLSQAVCGIKGIGEVVEKAPRTPHSLWEYVEKYSADLPARPASLVDRPEGKDVVLITGTTGGFGCDTLEHLLRDDSVLTVYAFNRKGARAMERQRAQFRNRGLDETLLDSPKFRMVEAVLHEPTFGLEVDLLDEIRRSVTHIMHNAWKVNFNLSIASFEEDIQGVRNLVDLALSGPYTTPASIIFVGSIGVFLNYQLPPPVLEGPIDDPTSAFGQGYGESKWVTERVLENVADRTGMHTIVMRLGQVTGDRTGYWNEKEWFPSLVKSALSVKCLPDLEGAVSWFAAYEAAQAFAELRRSPEPIVHLVHPHPTSWHTIVAPIAEELNVPLVSYDEWLAALDKSAEAGGADEVQAMKVNPALHLLPFFKAQGKSMSPDKEPMGLVYLSTEKAQQVSPSLSHMPVLDAGRARTWVSAWRRAGFL